VSATVLVIVRNPEIAIFAKAASPAIFAEPGTWVWSLGWFIVIPADDGDGVVRLQGVRWGLVVCATTPVYEAAGKAHSGSQGTGVIDFILDEIDVAEVRLEDIPLDMTWVVVVEAIIVSWRWVIVGLAIDIPDGTFAAGEVR